MFVVVVSTYDDRITCVLAFKYSYIRMLPIFYLVPPTLPRGSRFIYSKVLANA